MLDTSHPTGPGAPYPNGVPNPYPNSVPNPYPNGMPNHHPELPLEPAPLTEKGYNSNEANDHQPMSKITLFAIIALASTYVSTNIGGFFNGVVVIYMAEDFKTGLSNAEWLQIISNLTFACTAPIVGYLTDIYGRRNALILGMTTHCTGTVVVAAAPSFGAAVAGLAISGFGSAIAELSATAAIAELVPMRKRGLFLALTTLMTLPFVPSVLYSELISINSSWRWCYVLVIIWSVLTFLALGLTYFRLKLVRPSQESRRTALKQIDYLGILLLIFGSVLFILGLQFGGSEGYASPYCLGPLIAGIVLFIILLTWEWKGAKAPVIPFRLFRGQRVVGLSFGIVFIGGMYYETAADLGALIFTKVFAASPIQVGLMALGPSLGIMVGATGFNSLLSLSRGAAREMMTISAVLMVGFGGALAASTPDTMTLYLVLASLASVGIGGLLEPPATVATFACPQDLIGTVVSLVAFLRTIAGVVGYAIFTSVATAEGSQSVDKAIGTYAVKAGLDPAEATPFVEMFYDKVSSLSPGIPPSSISVNLTGVTPAIIDAAALGSQFGYGMAYRVMYYSQIPFGIIAVILCISLPNIKKLVTDQIIVRSK